MLGNGLLHATNGLAGVGHRYFGANLKILQIRLKAVNNIRKITKAMKMVATAKMKKEMERLNSGRNFGVNVVPTIMENDPYLQRKLVEEPSKRTLLIAVTGDKGLCGSINSGIVRKVREMIEQDRGKYSLLPVGDKGNTGLCRPFPDLITKAVTEVKTPINFWTAAAIADYIVRFDPEADRMIIVYNWFKNSMTSFITPKTLLSPEMFNQQYKNMVKYEAEEPDKFYSTRYFYDFYVASVVYNVLLNSAACEQSSRMNAMENATKNAGEVVEKLRMQFNRARQAKITMELIEIISGANSL